MGVNRSVLSLFACVLMIFFQFDLFAISIEPWFAPMAEFEVGTGYSHRYYPSIESQGEVLKYKSHDHRVNVGLGGSFWSELDFQLQFDFSKTKKTNWGLERSICQVRKLFLDDISGDPVSLSVGCSLFCVPECKIDDPSALYMSPWNCELFASVGKELPHAFDWIFRAWGYLGLGVGDSGACWMRPIVSIEGKFCFRHKIQVISETFFGFGRDVALNLSDFRGYSDISTRAVDLGVEYAYLFDIWGSLGVRYSYRAHAVSVPRNVHTVAVEYQLPFSFF